MFCSRTGHLHEVGDQRRGIDGLVVALLIVRLPEQDVVAHRRVAKQKRRLSSHAAYICAQLAIAYFCGELISRQKTHAES